MPRYLPAFTLCIILISCQDTGEEPVFGPYGPYAVTDQTAYAVGESLNLTIGSDYPEIVVRDCWGGPSFYLDLLLVDGWTEWSDHSTPCWFSSGPQAIYTIGEGKTHAARIVLPTSYPGTYRLRIPYRARDTSWKQFEVLTNTFIIEE